MTTCQPLKSSMHQLRNFLSSHCRQQAISVARVGSSARMRRSRRRDATTQRDHDPLSLLAAGGTACLLLRLLAFVSFGDVLSFSGQELSAEPRPLRGNWPSLMDACSVRRLRSRSPPPVLLLLKLFSEPNGVQAQIPFVHMSRVSLTTNRAKLTAGFFHASLHIINEMLMHSLKTLDARQLDLL